MAFQEGRKLDETCTDARPKAGASGVLAERPGALWGQPHARAGGRKATPFHGSRQPEAAPASIAPGACGIPAEGGQDPSRRCHAYGEVSWKRHENMHLKCDTFAHLHPWFCAFAGRQRRHLRQRHPPSSSGGGRRRGGGSLVVGHAHILFMFSPFPRESAFHGQKKRKLATRHAQMGFGASTTCALCSAFLAAILAFCVLGAKWAACISRGPC